MAIVDNSVANEISKMEENNSADSEVQVKAERIYDPENGKSCHQCRQRTKVVTPSCKMLKRDKPCTLKFCPKCLLNRYGENAEEVGKLEDWICPKCRGVCNCSICMKRKGFQPTGILTHTAKATGFNSVLELLDNKGTEVLEPRSVDSLSSKRTRDKENHCVEQKDAEANEDGLPKKEKKKASKRLKLDNANLDNKDADEAKAKPSQKIRKSKHPVIKAHREKKEDIVLPPGAPLAEIADIELLPQDVGDALQFLEFCNAFSEVLDINNGQPECIIRDITRGRVKRQGVYSSVVGFHIKLLSLIKKDVKKDGDAWLRALRRCIEQSQCTFDVLPMDFFDMGSSGYDNLEASEKLKILNFLCDEVLATEKLRNWIDAVAAKFDEEKKENKEKILAAKRKEKLLRQKAKDERTKAMLSAAEGTQPSLAEVDEHLSQLKTEADTVHAEVLASLELVPRKNQRSDAVRTDHLMFGSNGQRFWKLNSYNSCSNIILQDIGNLDSVTLQDKWLIYSEEEEKVVEKYISSLRDRKHARQPSDIVEEGMNSDSSESPESEHGLAQAMTETNEMIEDQPKQIMVQDSSESPESEHGLAQAMTETNEMIEEQPKQIIVRNSSESPESEHGLAQAMTETNEMIEDQPKQIMVQDSSESPESEHGLAQAMTETNEMIEDQPIQIIQNSDEIGSLPADTEVQLP